jgi:undecaprenyl-diphosphatase
MSQSRRTYILGSLALVLTGFFLILAYGVAHPTAFHGAVTSFDNYIDSHAHEGPALGAYILLFFTYLGNPFIVILIQIVFIIALAILRRQLLAGFFIGGLAFGETLSFIFKMILARARPTQLLYELPRAGYSFPSGHSVIAVVFYGFLGYCLVQFVHKSMSKLLISISTVIVIFLIGFSRVALEFHWPSDVIGGWLLGSIVLCLLIITFHRVRAKIFSGEFKFPHGTKFKIVLLLIATIGFIVCGYYVTHPLKIRSTIEYQLKA